jgi:hypothetical protein
VFRLASLTVFLSLAAGSAGAQEGPPASRTTMAGVYTESQARKGAEVYKKNCTSCHPPAAYTGVAFRRAWAGRPVYEFFDLIRTTMPNNSPGKLSRGQYAEITAYVLKLNGLPTGETELPGEDLDLQRITIEVQPPPVPPPAPPPPPPPRPRPVIEAAEAPPAIPDGRRRRSR